MRYLLAALLILTQPVFAQTDGAPLPDKDQFGNTFSDVPQSRREQRTGEPDGSVAIRVQGSRVASQGAILRGLDRIRGKTEDLTIAPGQTIVYERLEVTLSECRFPEGEENVEAFAYVTVRDLREEDPAFEGWMFASSPALSALDHPRYDVWVISCKT